MTVVETHLENGVDGDTIHGASSDTTQSRKDVNSFQSPMVIRDGQVFRFTKEMDNFTALCSYFESGKIQKKKTQKEGRECTKKIQIC